MDRRMLLRGRTLVGFLLAVVMLVLATDAQAEMLVFTSGRTMVVKGYRVSGETVTVMLRHGGEATFDRALVASIEPYALAPEPGSEVPEPPVADALPVAPPPGLDLNGRPFAELIETVAVKHGVDPVLVHAMIKAESNYEPRARSRAGARGLMQVMPTTAREFGIGNLYDPHANLEAGVQYLKSLLGRFDRTHAIAAYNAGPEAVVKYGGIPPFRETREYVSRVLSNYEQ